MSNGAQAHSDNVVSKKTHPTFHFFAGLASGLSSVVLLQPVDLLKTRVQQSRSHSLLPVLRSILASPHPIAGLWRGTVPSTLRTGFGSALYFTSLNSLRQLVANRQDGRTRNGSSLRVADGVVKTGSSVLPKLSNVQNIITGATARVLAGFILMPMTVIKVRYESDFYNYRSILDASKDIVRREGLRGFFTGFGATAIRDAPYAGLYVGFYEASKTRLNRAFGPTDGRATSTATSATINASSGVVAAGLATSITNPFDSIKTRLQLKPAKYGNMLRAAKIMIKEDGVKSFVDGLGLRMARKAISSALAWTVYEDLIGRAERRFAADDRRVAAV
jgi:solute carrier family 25, member 38